MQKLSFSNIAWSAEYDGEMYSFLSDVGFEGLEIAPTRIFPEKPYEHLAEAREFSKMLYEKYGLKISSMQSIWYGRKERIFGTPEERSALIEYTERAVDFAAAVGCGNLVFGCPKSRNVPDGMTDHMLIADEFFGKIADYAAQNGTVIALEPNPEYYGTNFINNTAQAFEYVRRINNKGLKVNVDLGTMISYNEAAALIANNIELVNHIHISEPRLVPIEKRAIHKGIFGLPYYRFISVEMGSCGDIEKVKAVARAIKSINTEV